MTLIVVILTAVILTFVTIKEGCVHFILCAKTKKKLFLNVKLTECSRHTGVKNTVIQYQYSYEYLTFVHTPGYLPYLVRTYGTYLWYVLGYVPRHNNSAHELFTLLLYYTLIKDVRLSVLHSPSLCSHLMISLYTRTVKKNRISGGRALSFTITNNCTVPHARNRTGKNKLIMVLPTKVQLE